MNTTANKKIALTALAAPVLAAIAVGVAAPAWAGSEKVEPQEPSEVSEVGLPTMQSEQQEQSAPSINIDPNKPSNNATLDQCTAARHNAPAAHDVYVDAFC